jgi:hypothetical protein
MSASYDEVMVSLGLEPSERPHVPGQCCAGDRAGYLRHKRRGEQACGASLEAHNAYTRAYMRELRRRKGGAV